MSRYFNRDLSWLSFNYRVLWEARDPSLPLYERIKFLAIYASNLDEFFKVRVASIQSLRLMKKKKQKKLGTLPSVLLEEINTEVNRQLEEFGEIFTQHILPELAQEGIQLLQEMPKVPEQQEFVRSYFEQEVMPMLHPELLAKGKVRHFLRDGAIYLAVQLKRKRRVPDESQSLAGEATIMGKTRYALVQIPSHYFPRFVELPMHEDKHYFMFLDDVVRYNLPHLFPGYMVVNSYSIKLNRNADLLIEDEFKGDLVDKIRKSLVRRHTGFPSRFLYDSSMPAKLLQYLKETFELRKRELLAGGRYHSFKDFFGFPNPFGERLARADYPPLPHLGLEARSSLFSAMRKQNWMLHFPYQSYDYVIRFLNQAAVDPKVTRIQTTQYRIASNSAIVNALIRAAQNGKDVSVFVELKARFDEASNLRSAKEMEKAGIKITYSIPGLKVHAKVALVTRAEEEGERRYAFLSTGNFNEKTARIYADHGYFSADPTITAELIELFHYLKDQAYQPPTFKKLLVAQFNMRDRFESLIRREITHAKAGRKGYMLLKMNNLEDEAMMELLYEASQAGVKIDLIIRGICRLRPAVPGLSDNITITRLVDQFLEHARVYTFFNDGQREMYLGSADWMTRNLSRRVEVIFPLEDAALQDEIVEILEMQLADNTKAVHISSENQNVRVPHQEGDAIVRMQTDYYALLEQRMQAEKVE
ncbi:MAG: polyphosphate kinase 1 [Bacteroidota bacterium]